MGACSLPTGAPPLPAGMENALPHHARPVLQGVKSIWHGHVGRGGCFDKKESKQEWENAPEEERHRVYREQ